MDNDALFQKLLPYLGGNSNIGRREFRNDQLHAMVKDRSIVNLEKLQNLPEVGAVKLTGSHLLVEAAKKNKEDSQMVDNKQIAVDVLKAVGGKENVDNVVHCVTRLRFALKDSKLPDDEAVRKINGVMGVVLSGGQYQVIIGQNVPKVYQEVCSLIGLTPSKAIDENLDKPREKLTPKLIGGRILNYMAGCMTPLIPLLIAAGMIKAISALLGPDLLGVITVDSDTYILMDFVYNAGFYFLPIFIGANAVKQFKINPMLGAYMGAILIAPTFVQMADEETTFSILGIPVIMNNYSQTVLPIMLSALALSGIYKLLEKIIPDVISTVLTPFLSILIATPVALLLLAPLGTIVGNAISDGLIAFSNTTGFVGVAVIGGLWEFLVMTGMHMVLLVPFMMMFLEDGFQSGAIMGAGCATWACFGVALGAFLRLKNKKAKATSLGFFIAGIIGGITEPALYGLCFKYRRCFLAVAIGGVIGGAYAGLVDLRSYVMGSTNFLSVLSYAGGTTANLINGIVACLLAFVAAAVAAYLIGFSKKELVEE